MTPEELARLLSREGQSSSSSALDVLDEREFEVFSILSQGYSASQIESEFGIDRTALAALKKSIQRKLNLKSEIQLLQYAVKHGREQ